MGRPREVNVPSLGIHPSSEPSLGRGPAEIGKIGLWAGDASSLSLAACGARSFFGAPFLSTLLIRKAGGGRFQSRALNSLSG
jgi:hypothetical protein